MTPHFRELLVDERSPGLGGSLRSPTNSRTAKTKNRPNDGSFKAPRTLRSAFFGMEKQDELDTMIVGMANDWYDAKHPIQTIDEIEMINSLVIEECPFYHCRHFHKDGFNKFKIQDWCTMSLT